MHCRVVEVVEGGLLIQRISGEEIRFAAEGAITQGLALAQIDIGENLLNMPEAVLPFDLTVLGRSDAAIQRGIELHNWMRELDLHGLSKLNPHDPTHQTRVQAMQADKRLNLTKTGIWTLYRHQKAVAANGLGKLIPNYPGRGSPKEEIFCEAKNTVITVPRPRLDSTVSSLLTLSIEHCAGNDEKKPIHVTDVKKQLRSEIAKENSHRKLKDYLALPDDKTISRWIKKLHDPFDLEVRRVGTARANQLFRSNRARIPAERILQYVQFDDVDSRIYALDEETGLPWGSLIFTFGVDERSQAPMVAIGSPVKRNSCTAIDAVVQAAAIKDMSRPEFQMCNGVWRQRGRAGLLILDNASYNNGGSFQRAMLDLNQDYRYAKPKEPTNKSAIEQFNRIFKHSFCSTQPGQCVKKNDRDGIEEALKRAKYGEDEVIRRVMHWIVDEYLNTQGEDGLTPNDRWDEQAADVDLRPPAFTDHRFHEFSLPEVLRFRASGGLERKNLRYQSTRLDQVRRVVGSNSSVRIRVRPKRLETILVADEAAKEWFTVPCVEDPRYVRGLSDEQHSMNLAFIKNSKKYPRPTVAQMALSQDDMRSEAEKDKENKNMKARAQSYRVRRAFKDAPVLRAGPAATSRPAPTTTPSPSISSPALTTPSSAPLNILSSMKALNTRGFNK